MGKWPFLTMIESIAAILSGIFNVLSYLQNIDFYKRDGYFCSTLKIIFFCKNGKRDYSAQNSIQNILWYRTAVIHCF